MTKDTRPRGCQDRRKMISESTKDYFLLDNRIYPVSTLTQRAKLESLKEFIEFQEEPKYVHTPIRRPVAPKVNLRQDLKALSTDKRRQICKEIERNLKIGKNAKMVRKLEAEMSDVVDRMGKHTQVNNSMLKKLEESGDLSTVEYQSKTEFFTSLLQRKENFAGSILKLFSNIFTKEYLNENGEITLTQLLYSCQSLSQMGSLEKLGAEEELTSQKDLLVRQINLNLELVRGPPTLPEIPPVEESKPKFQLNIPLIMTKDKRQELEKEKQTAQRKSAQCEIQLRIATQLSLIQRTNALHSTMADTSLVAVGNYLSRLTDHILEHYFQDIIELINMPYGKPAIERLSQLQGRTSTDDILPYILSEKLFQEMQQKILSSDCQKGHHKVLFDCLNSSLNVYRPYFNFKGEIYPWLVTEKGMTFYSISDANIEEVLEKCKISIMERAANLCGVLGDRIPSQGVQKVYQAKRNERLKRVVQQEMEGEPHWPQTQSQQACLMIDFGNQMLDWLLEETLDQMRRLQTAKG